MTEKIFQCRECGACCQGTTTVSLSDRDVQSLLEFLGLSFDEALPRYLRKNGTSIQMQTRDGHCIFYRKGCTVHPAKPTRCRQWPLHDSILSDETNLEIIRSSCRGVDSTLSYADFCMVLRQYLESKQ